MIKKKIGCCFLVLFSSVCLLQSSSNEAYAKTKLTEKTMDVTKIEAKQLKIDVDSCNAHITQTSDNKLSLKYDTNIYEVSFQNNKDELKVKIKGKSKKAWNFKKRPTLYIPKKINAEMIKINSDDAGVDVDSLEANLDVYGNNSGVSVCECDNSKYSMNVEFVDCGGSVKLADAKKSEVSITNDDSGIAYPEGWRAKKNKDARINIKAVNSGVSIETE